MLSVGERFGTTWWGRRWIQALEQLSEDFENRLPRGKAYAEKGAVSHFHVRPGEIEARVHGTRSTYTVTLALPALTRLQWQKALERITQESRYAASLLAGYMPEDLDVTFREAGASLFPRVPKELQSHCTCPDWANPCKHVAAVCYITAEALDRDPWLIFDLRGKPKTELMAILQEAMNAAPGDPESGPSEIRRTDQALLDLLQAPTLSRDTWHSMPKEQFDLLLESLPSIRIPRAVPPDPCVFTQLGPLPHARIEASLALASLLHQTGKWVQLQIEEGELDLESGENGEGESDGEPVVSPFDIPASKESRKPKKYGWHRRMHRSGS